MTLIAGPYHARTDEHDGIPLALYARQSLAEFLDAEADELFTVTKQCLDRYARDLRRSATRSGTTSRRSCPEFNFGAMENPGLVIFRDEFIYRSAVTDSERETRATVIAHEMAHMWFGDLVTMAWWDDLWLNESFAEYMGTRVAAEATRFTEHLDHVRDAATRPGACAPTSARPPTRWPRPTSPTPTLALLNFDGISYAKGAAVLKQLVAWVGDEAFLAGLNEHFAAHAYGNATLADLLGALSKASGRDLSAWAERVAAPGPGQHAAGRGDPDDRGRTPSVAIVQTAPEAYPTLRPHRLGIGLYDRGAGRHGGAPPAARGRPGPGADGGRTDGARADRASRRPTCCCSTTAT